jgi:hypothetical protein
MVLVLYRVASGFELSCAISMKGSQKTVRPDRPQKSEKLQSVEELKSRS